MESPMKDTTPTPVVTQQYCFSSMVRSLPRLHQCCCKNQKPTEVSKLSRTLRAAKLIGHKAECPMCGGMISTFHYQSSRCGRTPKTARILHASAVLMMSINKWVNEGHNHDPLLEASQEYLGDQVMEKMASPWWHRSLSHTEAIKL